MILGPVSDTFGANKLNLFLVAGGGVGAVVLFILWAQSGYASLPIALGLPLIVAVTGFFLYYILTLKVTLYADGVSAHSFVDHTEMRWDQVERFYYHAVQVRINLIPTPTHYFFILVDRQAHKLWLTSSSERPQELGAKLIQFTQPHLLRKALDQYSSAGEVSFGPVRVSKAEGVSIKSMLLRKKVPFNQLASYRIEAGKFYIFRVGEKRSNGLDIALIPNAFALINLLETVTRPACGMARTAIAKP